MKTFSLTVLAAEKPFFEGECTSITVPAEDGSYGILANHANMIGAVVPGTIKITLPDNREIIAVVSQGIVKVEANQVLMLVYTAELPEEIDINRALRSKEEAKEALLQKKSMNDYLMAQAKMARAISRLKAKNYPEM